MNPVSFVYLCSFYLGASLTVVGLRFITGDHEPFAGVSLVLTLGYIVLLGLSFMKRVRNTLGDRIGAVLGAVGVAALTLLGAPFEAWNLILVVLWVGIIGLNVWMLKGHIRVLRVELETVPVQPSKEALLGHRMLGQR